jgi:lipopolysaccharide export system protein LptA
MWILVFVILYKVKADSFVVKDSITYIYGDVEFKDDTVEIYANKGIIDKNKIILQEKVKVVTKDIELETNLGEYFWNRKIILPEEFIIMKEEEVIKGKMGKYFMDTLWINENIEYTHKKEHWHLIGDSGKYIVKEKVALILGKMIFTDVDDSIKIIGKKGIIFSDTMACVEEEVRLFVKEVECRGDTLIYFFKKEIAYLRGGPQIISTHDTLTGNEVIIKFSNSNIKEIKVVGKVEGKRWKKFH